MPFMRAYREDAVLWVVALRGHHLPDGRRRVFEWMNVSFTSRAELQSQVQAEARRWWAEPHLLADAGTLREDPPRPRSTWEPPEHGLIVLGHDRLAMWGLQTSTPSEDETPAQSPSLFT